MNNNMKCSFWDVMLGSKLDFPLQLFHQVQHFLLIIGSGYNLNIDWHSFSADQAFLYVFSVKIIKLIFKFGFILPNNRDGDDSSRIVQYIPGCTKRVEVLQFL